MNERIQELALQAKLGPALLLHYYGKVDALTDTEQDGLEQIEKFAELIVRECEKVILAKIAETDIEGEVDRAWEMGMECGVYTIKEHFGVEL